MRSLLMCNIQVLILHRENAANHFCLPQPHNLLGESLNNLSSNSYLGFYFYLRSFHFLSAPSQGGPGSIGNSDGGGRGVQAGLTSRLPDIHGSAEL